MYDTDPQTADGKVLRHVAMSPGSKRLQTTSGRSHPC